MPRSDTVDRILWIRGIKESPAETSAGVFPVAGVNQVDPRMARVIGIGTQLVSNTIQKGGTYLFFASLTASPMSSSVMGSWAISSSVCSVLMVH